MKVIIVDDQKKDLYNILDELMDKNNIEYKLFNDPTLALNYMTKDIYAAFLDIEMPGINGVELAEKLIEINPKVKLIFITSFTKYEDKIREKFSNNILSFMYKPFSKMEFENVINSLNCNSNIKINMFGTFDIFINDKLVEFSCAKSKELLALLIVYRGKTLTKDSIINHLYPDKNYTKADSLYRHARCKLIATLDYYGLSHLVNFKCAQISFIPNSSINCDYYNHIDNIKLFNENDNEYNINIFLKDYDWSIEYLN